MTISLARPDLPQMADNWNWQETFAAWLHRMEGGTRYAEYSWGKVLHWGQLNQGQS
jgi:hypothetical protein